MNKNVKGFTLLEILIAVVIATFVMFGLLTFFGDTFQKFVQHEDTLTNSRELHKLLEYLRKDIEIISPGSKRDNGNIFPQQTLHMYHAPDSKVLQHFAWKKDVDGEPFKDADLIKKNLPPGEKTNRLLMKYNALSSSCSWSTDKTKGKDKLVHISRLTTPDCIVNYKFDEETATITRYT